MAKNLIVIEDRQAYLQNFEKALDRAREKGALSADDVIHYLHAHKDADLDNTIVSQFQNYQACKTFEELKSSIRGIAGDKLLLIDIDLVGVHGTKGEGFESPSNEIAAFYAGVINHPRNRSCILLYSEGLQPQSKADRIVKSGAPVGSVSSLQKSPLKLAQAEAVVNAGLNLFFNQPLADPAIALKLQKLHGGYSSTDEFKDWFIALNAGGKYPEGALQWLTSDWLSAILKRTKLKVNIQPLSNYFESGRILLIGNALSDTPSWNLFLASELTGQNVEFSANTQQKIGNVYLRHFSDANMLSSPRISEELLRFDVVILGLESRDDDAKEQLSIVNQAVKKAYELAALKAVSVPIPEVMVFPTAPAAFPQMWLAESEPEPFLHRVLMDGQHGNYAEFRAMLIRMLRDAVASSLNLSTPQGTDRLNKWLEQFDETDQPLALRLLRYFRYYSAESQRSLLDVYLSSYKNSISSESSSSIVWLTYLGRPNKSGAAVLTLAAKTSWAREILSHAGPRGLLVKSYDDLITDLVPAVSSLSEGESIDIYLIDDVIGSGGQLIEYLNKFLNDHLWNQVASASEWGKFLDAVAPSTHMPRLRFNAVFVTGIRCKDVEKLFSEFSEVIPLRPELKGTSPRTGTLEFDIRSKEEDDPHRITIGIHIVDYTASVFDQFSSDCLPREAIETMLYRYPAITQPRDREHWLQFEPWGWKECGGLVTTHMNCPGNTLPIVWGDARERTPLFPRFFNSWDDGKRGADRIIRALEIDIASAEESERLLLAYVLKSLTVDSIETIARIIHLDEKTIEDSFVITETRLSNDTVFRNRLRQLFSEAC